MLSQQMAHVRADYRKERRSLLILSAAGDT